jgi:hypothetical protein
VGVEYFTCSGPNLKEPAAHCLAFGWLLAVAHHVCKRTPKKAHTKQKSQQLSKLASFVQALEKA